MTSTRDMLKDLPDQRINEIAKDMNEVQRKCFTVYSPPPPSPKRSSIPPTHDGSKPKSRCERSSEIEFLSGYMAGRDALVRAQEKQRCRKLENGIGLIHGPGGTGKIKMVATLAESVTEQERDVLIVTSQNSAADSVIEKLMDSKYMVVRAHSLGLERMTILQSNTRVERPSNGRPVGTQAKAKDPSSGPKTTVLPNFAGMTAFFHMNKDQDDDTEPVSNDDDPEPDSHMLDIAKRVTADFMKIREEAYREKESIPRPADPRIPKLMFAIHTWVLKPADIIPSKWSRQPTEDQVTAGAHDECSTL